VAVSWLFQPAVHFDKAFCCGASYSNPDVFPCGPSCQIASGWQGIVMSASKVLTARQAKATHACRFPILKFAFVGSAG